MGGYFTANAGEMVYLGHIALDCKYDPVPWRFYIEGKSEFTQYAQQYSDAYPYLKGKKFIYRLWETKEFGTPYSLGNGFEVEM